MNVESGDVKVITADKRVDEKLIRETIVKTKFTVVSIKGPLPIKR